MSTAGLLQSAWAVLRIVSIFKISTVVSLITVQKYLVSLLNLDYIQQKTFENTLYNALEKEELGYSAIQVAFRIVQNWYNFVTVKKHTETEPKPET